jgi:general secretion pathway protein A
MYERFFGLSRQPFSMTPDPDLLLLTESHQEALAGLNYAILARKGFVVLTGEAGTGKTTLLRKLLEMMPASEAQTSVVLNPTLTASEFLELLLLNFGNAQVPDSKAQRLHLLERMLQDADRAGRTLVLVIDEAHKLTFEVLEEIRLLTNFETSERKLLQIVLSGQPELKDVLNRPDLWQLKQRVAIRLNVGPLMPAELSRYLQHRWRRAGGDRLPFSEDAISMIALRSRGIPRLINAICDNALLIGFSGLHREIDATMIAEVERDLDLSPFPRATAARANGSPVSNGTPVAKASPVLNGAPVSNASNGSGYGKNGHSTMEVNARESRGSERRQTDMPLQLEVLQRYMPRQEFSFAGLRWRRKPNLNPVREGEPK